MDIQDDGHLGSFQFGTIIKSVTKGIPRDVFW